MLKSIIAHGRARLLGEGRAVDERGRRVVAVIECVLNQNARDTGAATCPALNRAVVDVCHEYDVGMIQMPCPEMACLGLDRARKPGQSIRELLDTDSGRLCCRKIAAEIADRLQAYDRAGYRVLAVLGGNVQSPGCAVHGSDEGLLPNSGILMQELHAELRTRGLRVPFRGMRDVAPALFAEDLRWLRSVFADASGSD